VLSSGDSFQERSRPGDGITTFGIARPRCLALGLAGALLTLLGLVTLSSLLDRSPPPPGPNVTVVEPTKWILLLGAALTAFGLWFSGVSNES
jgi:hypothetical protein